MRKTPSTKLEKGQFVAFSLGTNNGIHAGNLNENLKLIRKTVEAGDEFLFYIKRDDTNKIAFDKASVAHNPSINAYSEEELLEEGVTQEDINLFKQKLAETEMAQTETVAPPAGGEPAAPKPQPLAAVHNPFAIEIEHGEPDRADQPVTIDEKPVNLNNIAKPDVATLDAGTKDDFPAWKTTKINQVISAVLGNITNIKNDIDAADAENKSEHIAKLDAEQPSGVFYKLFDWAALKNASEQEKQIIIKFLSRLYGLEPSQIRANETSVYATPIEIFETSENGETKYSYNHDRLSLQPQISDEEIKADNLLKTLQWANGQVASRDAFSAKFSRAENVEYHHAYAASILGGLTNAFPHAPALNKAIRNEEFGQSLIQFKVKENGFQLGFNDKPETPELVTTTLDIDQKKDVLSNAADVALDAEITNLKFKMAAKPHEWKYGVKIKSENDENFLKVAAVFEQEGFNLDQKTREHLHDLLVSAENLAKYQKNGRDYNMRLNQRMNKNPPAPPETPPAPNPLG